MSVGYSVYSTGSRMSIPLTPTVFFFFSEQVSVSVINVPSVPKLTCVLSLVPPLSDYHWYVVRVILRPGPLSRFDSVLVAPTVSFWLKLFSVNSVVSKVRTKSLCPDYFQFHLGLTKLLSLSERPDRVVGLGVSAGGDKRFVS